ncbi:unnamed protein product [Ilex paraguariensis]|uniref:Pentatricopeptide repeat-containing protein n=1 Tax=Ilex paraguariensis TaxID=185542 RepID=A0ABC8SNI5_9AQUA
MFNAHGALRFLRNFKPILALYSGQPFSSANIAVKGVHSFHQFKQKRPIRQINRKVKKSVISVKKEDVDPIAYMRDTIRNISNILRYSAWDFAQEQLENLSIRWDSYTINQVLKTHPPMEKAWLFFNWASRLKRFKHDQFTYTTMLDIFGEAGRISSMNYVFQQMQEKGIKIDAVTYTSLLHWLSNDGDVDGSVRLWEEMKVNGCRPTVVSYTAFMKVLLDHNRVKDATEVYRNMLQSGCSPNCYTYTILMDHLAGSGKFNEVLEIFSKMQDTGVQPDKATCNILIEKCCKARETWAMMKILQYMKENSLVLRYPVYREALETLRVACQSDVLLRQVNRHLSVEHNEEFSAPNSDAPSIIDQGLILNLLNRQNFVAVDQLVADMMDKAVKLDSGIASTIIEVNSASSRPNGALLAYEYSVKMGINIKRTAYLALIGVFIRTNSFPKVVEIVEELFKEGLSLGTHLSALLIYKLGCARDPISAARIFDLLPDDQKSTAAYTALIGAYFASANAGKGLETFKIMKREGIRGSLSTYDVLLDGLEKYGKAGELEYYRREKKSLQADGHFQSDVTMEDKTCNLLFSGAVVS